MEPAPETRGPASPLIASKPKRRISGLVWILIGIAGLFVVGFLFSALRHQQAPAPRTSAPPAEIFFGVHEFIDRREGGVTFNDVYPPDSPADKAGLVGGDIITSFDAHPVKNKGEILELLRQTPVGKTVEVAYLRDGAAKKTSVTTISPEQFHALAETFEGRTSRHGQLGFQDISSNEVQVEGGNISGVRLNGLSPSGPAALAGLLEGDVVIEFDGVPIRTRGELITRVRRAVPYSTVKVIVMRGTERLEFPVKIGKRN